MRVNTSILILTLLLAGCGSSPKSHFYTLGVIPPSSHRVDAVAQGAPVQVGAVTLPAALDRLSMVTRGTGDQVSVSDQDRWAAPLDELIRRTMTEDLRARLGSGAVLAPGDPSPPGGVRGVILNVQQFAAGSNGQVVLEVDWDVEQKGKQHNPRHEDIRIGIAGPGGEAIANAMSRAVAALADRVAAGL